MDKSILVEKIKRWLDIEMKIANIQKEVKELRKQKKSLSTDLSVIMKSKQLECITLLTARSYILKRRPRKESIKSICRTFLANTTKTTVRRKKFVHSF